MLAMFPANPVFVLPLLMLINFYLQESLHMPFVNIKITQEAVTKDQKFQLVAGVTELLATVLNKNPATTHVIIDEVNTDNWGIKGELVTERRKRGS
ncbi:4-oxalocrotonate tautomerase family protein [Porticoccaceae bacterium]|nr:4-oxalocrotonate tautomerase family protein [Porticoccaceae bacterium]